MSSIMSEGGSERASEGGKKGARERGNERRQGVGGRRAERENVCVCVGGGCTLAQTLAGLGCVAVEYGDVGDDHGRRRKAGDDQVVLVVGHGLDVYLALLPLYPPSCSTERARARAREGVRDTSYNDGRILGQDIM